MNIAITILLFIVGVINFLPIIGVLSADRLTSAYSIDLIGNDLIILMRHRALLFGIIGGFLLFSIFNPLYQPAAITMAMISMLGFLILTWSTGGYNSSIAKIVVVDIVGVICLILAIFLRFITTKN